MIECTELLVLQEFDLEIDRLDEKIRQIREKASRMEADIQKEQELLDKKSALLKKIQLRKKGFETELGVASEKLKTLELKLRNVGVTPSAYVALEKEIATVKEQISDLETKVLEDMEKLETLEKDLTKGHKVLAGLRQHLEEVKKRQAGEIKALEEARDLAWTKRQQAGLKIPGDRLQVYEELRHLKKGRVIWDAETPGCPACGMSLPGGFLTPLIGRPVADHCPYCRALIRWTGLLDAIR
ncbi:MAG: hypothetical protein OZSIB_0568 [Candidatus Ozemobacter sibiricus]|uniref:CT398-like coiled coil hairpin domain-containing protein n=1 Tax=Candidatus Ozemobacter sibiricus TaxID=2268124 RepID=A0A367Z9T9_9BACT|nr:MAG: hypothetical protein OZSIB_0568 [Candidatus Ozemobacter sibiricus]